MFPAHFQICQNSKGVVRDLGVIIAPNICSFIAVPKAAWGELSVLFEDFL